HAALALFLACLPALLGPGGCGHTRPHNDLTFSFYGDPEFRWQHVGRLLLLPLVNESAYPEAADQMRRPARPELPQLGGGEGVVTPPDVAQRFARLVRDGGRFDERELIDLARVAGADAIVAGTLSHYTPYFRPRIGLTLQAISPDLGRVVASVDGLWDTNNLDV